MEEYINSLERKSYSVICEKQPKPCIYFDSYDLAEKWAKSDQPDYRPFYIVERTERFKLVRKINGEK